MPEGSEARCFADKKRARYKQKVLVGLARNASSAKHSNIANFEEFCQELPLIVDTIYSHGKKVIWRLKKSDDIKAGYFYIVISLGLTGKFVNKYQNGCDFAWHFGEHFKDGDFPWCLIDEKLYFLDSRHHGQIYFITGEEELDQFLKKKVGIDLLDFAIRRKAGRLKKGEEAQLKKKWLEKASSGRRTEWQIVQFMMKQEEFAGIGNYVKAESLFRTLLPPDVTLGVLVDQYPEKLEELLENVLDVLLESYEAHGATLRDFVNLDGNKGDFQCLVYGKSWIKFEGKRYEIIKEQTGDKRATHWCPKLQKLPKSRKQKL
jgi:formamidopyrimidine-DNA glycosylase